MRYDTQERKKPGKKNVPKFRDPDQFDRDRRKRDKINRKKLRRDRGKW